MFGTLGGPELFVILVIALVVFGPRKLPEIGKSIGRMMGEFRRASNDFKRTIEDEVEADRLRANAQQIEAPVQTPVQTTIETPLEAPTGPPADPVASSGNEPAPPSEPTVPHETPESSVPRETPAAAVESK
jgi:sec-independent protein translocase protein TatB